MLVIKIASMEIDYLKVIPIGYFYELLNTNLFL